MVSQERVGELRMITFPARPGRPAVKVKIVETDAAETVYEVIEGPRKGEIIRRRKGWIN